MYRLGLVMTAGTLCVLNWSMHSWAEAVAFALTFTLAFTTFVLISNALTSPAVR